MKCEECPEFQVPRSCSKFGVQLELEQGIVALEDGEWIATTPVPADGCQNAAYLQALKKHVARR